MSKNIGKIVRANSLPSKEDRLKNVIYQVAVPRTATYIDYAVDENGDIKTPTFDSSVLGNNLGKVKTVDKKEPDENGDINLGIDQLIKNSEGSMKISGTQDVKNNFSIKTLLGKNSTKKSLANIKLEDYEQNIDISVIDNKSNLGGKILVSKNNISLESSLTEEDSDNPTIGLIEISKEKNLIRIQRIDSNEEGFGFTIEKDQILFTSNDGNVAEITAFGIFERGSKLLSEFDLTESITYNNQFNLSEYSRDLKQTSIIKYKAPAGTAIKTGIFPKNKNSRLGQKITVIHYGLTKEILKITTDNFFDYTVRPLSSSSFIFDGERWILISKTDTL